MKLRMDYLNLVQKEIEHYEEHTGTKPGIIGITAYLHEILVQQMGVDSNITSLMGCEVRIMSGEGVQIRLEPKGKEHAEEI